MGGGERFHAGRLRPDRLHTVWRRPDPDRRRHLMAILATCTYFDAVTVLCEHREPDWRSYLPLPLGANRIVSA
jgi:hypothetical protein